MTRTYLDYNATGVMRPDVKEAMFKVMDRGFGNPSSVHGEGRAARALVETARDSVGALVGSRARDVVFTGGGTEGNNAIIAQKYDTILYSAVEHDCVLEAVRASGAKAVELPVTSEGLMDLNALKAALDVAQGRVLVTVMLANNETGVIQPVKQIAQLAHDSGAIIHTDAIQAAGKIPIDFNDLGVDLMTLSAHKLGGPQGVGAIVIKPALAFQPLLRGGGQELGRRSGTENVAGIHAFGVAAALALKSSLDVKSIRQMRDDLEHRVREIAPDAIVWGEGAERLPNTSCLSMPAVSGEVQVMAFDVAGIAVSSGSACSSGKVKESHVLKAMGAEGDDASNSVRISMGWGNTPADVDAIVAAWSELYKRTAAKRQVV